MRQHGQIKSWNDDRGFGFIRPDQKGPDLFFHISALPNGVPRPEVGQRVSYLPVLADDGKARATAVTSPNWTPAATPAPIRRPEKPRRESPVRSQSPPWSLPRLLVLPVFAGYWAMIAAQFGFQPMLLLVYAGMSLVAFFIYASDKAAAQSNAGRVPEKTLLAFSLWCGWPGALIAQQTFRHKTKKLGFIVPFWLSIVGNFVLFYLWHAYGLAALL